MYYENVFFKLNERSHCHPEVPTGHFLGEKKPVCKQRVSAEVLVAQ